MPPQTREEVLKAIDATIEALKRELRLKTLDNLVVPVEKLNENPKILLPTGRALWSSRMSGQERRAAEWFTGNGDIAKIEPDRLRGKSIDAVYFDDLTYFFDGPERFDKTRILARIRAKELVESERPKRLIDAAFPEPFRPSWVFTPADPSARIRAPIFPIDATPSISMAAARVGPVGGKMSPRTAKAWLIWQAFCEFKKGPTATSSSGPF